MVSHKMLEVLALVARIPEPFRISSNRTLFQRFSPHLREDEVTLTALRVMLNYKVPTVLSPQVMDCLDDLGCKRLLVRKNRKKKNRPVRTNSGRRRLADHV